MLLFADIVYLYIRYIFIYWWIFHPVTPTLNKPLVVLFKAPIYFFKNVHFFCSLTPGFLYLHIYLSLSVVLMFCFPWLKLFWMDIYMCVFFFVFFVFFNYITHTEMPYFSRLAARLEDQTLQPVQPLIESTIWNGYSCNCSWSFALLNDFLWCS